MDHNTSRFMKEPILGPSNIYYGRYDTVGYKNLRTSDYLKRKTYSTFNVIIKYKRSLDVKNRNFLRKKNKSHLILLLQGKDENTIFKLNEEIYNYFIFIKYEIKNTSHKYFRDILL